jgi:DNA-binding transcriptional MerR regulator
MERFTRHEAVILTRTSPSRLAYLAKTGIVVPYRLQQAGRWRLFYSWDQILELRTIHHLRQQTSLQTIRKILRFLEDQGGDHRLCNQKLVITEDGVSWVAGNLHAGQDPQVVQVVGRTKQSRRHVGQLQLLTVPTVPELVADLWEVARQSRVIDFEQFKQRLRSRQE